MNIVYTIGLIAAFISGFFVALKSMQIGLRWNIQTANKQEPELHSPIAPIIESAQQNKVDKANKYSTEQVNEWMFGEGK